MTFLDGPMRARFIREPYGYTRKTLETIMEDKIEFLTVAEFAERMKISRATVFNWINSGYLQPGIHFTRIGRSVRFLWCAEALNDLMSLANSSGIEKMPVEIEKSTDKSPLINLDY